MYQLKRNFDGVVRLSDGTLIARDEFDFEWRDYVQWTEQGNEALPDILNDELIKQKVSEIRAHRKKMEEETILSPGGIPVRTNLNSQNRIRNALEYARLSGVEEIDFESEGGWFTLTIPEVEAIFMEISRFSQGLFTTQHLHEELVSGLENDTDIKDYDFSEGWK